MALISWWWHSCTVFVVLLSSAVPRRLPIWKEASQQTKCCPPSAVCKENQNSHWGLLMGTVASPMSQSQRTRGPNSRSWEVYLLTFTVARHYWKHFTSSVSGSAPWSLFLYSPRAKNMHLFKRKPKSNKYKYKNTQQGSYVAGKAENRYSLVFYRKVRWPWLCLINTVNAIIWAFIFPIL